MKILQPVMRYLQRRFTRFGGHVHGLALRHPGKSVLVLLTLGVALGVGLRSGVGFGEQIRLQADNQRQRAQIDATRREVNAMSARLAELQAQANRLNALGERLTRIGKLNDGEFDFGQTIGVGGSGPVRDMPAAELRAGMDRLQHQFATSGEQLALLETLLFNRKLEQNALPSRAPVRNGYITSGFGLRADPFGGGVQYHKGIDFKADIGDPVLSVADGVVIFSGVRSGYGNVVDVDHGNGYVTRYAHNSRLLVREGDLVRVGDHLAEAGSSGRSTNVHVHFEVWENGVAVDPRKFLDAGQPRRSVPGPRRM